MPIDPSTRLVDPNRGFRIWSRKDIWMGFTLQGQLDQNGKSVPNVGDLVVDYDNPLFWKVVAIDSTIPIDNSPPPYTVTLEWIDLSRISNTSNTSIHIEGSSSIANEAMYAFYNDSVDPHVINLDGMFRIYGSSATMVKLFLGTDVSENGEVISVTFNSSGDVISENVDVVPIDPSNPAIQKPLPIPTNTTLLDGETVTLVTYTSEGVAVEITPFIVKQGNTIRSAEENGVYITDISLVTNMLDDVELDLVKVPISLPVTAGDFQAKLHYSDGVVRLIPIDGGLCRLHGLLNFNTNILNIAPLVLSYYPNDNEPLINTSNPTLRSIDRTYRLKTITNNLDSAFKIYISPKWNSIDNEYNNRYFLTNAENDVFVELLDGQIKVESPDGSNVNTKPSVEAINLRCIVKISDIIPFGFGDYTFVQNIKIKYSYPTSDNNTPWLIDYIGSQSGVYGSNLIAKMSTLGQFAMSFKTNIETQTIWRETLYNLIYPIYDINTRIEPVLPTHFRIEYNGTTSGDITMDGWDQLHNSLDGTRWDTNSTVNLIWINRDDVTNEVKTLGISPMMIHSGLV